MKRDAWNRRSAGIERAMHCARVGMLAIVAVAMVLLGVLSLAILAHGQQTGNTHYASQYPGSTVAARVTAAQNDCTPNLPCLIVIGADLSPMAEGTLPAPCALCTWSDYRNGGAPRMATAASAALQPVWNYNPAPFFKNTGVPRVYNCLLIAGDLGQDCVKQINTGTPVTLTTYSSVEDTVGHTVCITAYPPAPTANVGCFTLSAVTNAPCCTYQYTNGSAASYSDTLSVSLTYDAFPASVTDQLGTIHLLYYESTGHTGAAGPGSVKERTSTDGGVTWSAAANVFNDTSNSCSGPANCDFRNPSLGIAPNGWLVAWAWRNDPNAGTSKNPYFSYWNGSAWATPTAFSTTPPDSSAWQSSSSSPVFNCGGNPWAALSTTGGNLYLLRTGNFGQSWSTPVLVSAPGFTAMPTNEGTFVCPVGSTQTIVGFVRDDAAGSLIRIVSTNGGTSWTAGLVFTPTRVPTPPAGWKFVDPQLVPGPAGQWVLTFGERDGDCGNVPVVPYCAAVDVVTYNSTADLVAGKVGSFQTLITLAVDDATYPTITSTQDRWLLHWYAACSPSSVAQNTPYVCPESSGRAKLYSTFLSF